jgi:hypothetical protein
MFSVNVPLPSLDDKTVKELKKLLSGMEGASSKGPVRGGVMSEGDAAAYALVWEWGNARQTQKGPKTVLGTNPDGEQVWLSIQAPFGYIRINEDQYLMILQDEMEKADFGDFEADTIRLELELISMRAGDRIAEVIRRSVPVDTGNLQESIVRVEPDDPDLLGGEANLELGSEHFNWGGYRR